MCRHSEENDTQCLGIFDEDVRRFDAAGAHVKIPQIGWNTIRELKGGIFEGVPESSYCYFVHSYHASLGAHTIAVTDYIQPYSAALQKDNFTGVQFHPEKSAVVGEWILQNFLSRH